jgi:hypothetical protein
MLSPRVQLIGMEVEALVGLWLVSGYARRGAWVAGITLFAILAAVSVYLIAKDQTSCGCFGRVEVSPWASLTLDAACVFALAVARPAFDSARRVGFERATVVLVAVGAAVFIGSFSTPAGMRVSARLRGEVILLPYGDSDAGSAPRGEVRTVLVVAENLTDEPVKFVGGTASCSCVAIADFPLIVPPHAQVEVRVLVKFAGETGTFLHNFEWYTDSPFQPCVGGRIAGQVEPGVVAE